MAAVRHLRFLTVRNISCWFGVLFPITCVLTQKFQSCASSAFLYVLFTIRNGQEGQSASLCQILSKSLETRLKYSYFFIFQDGGRRHLGFLKFQIFNDQDAQEVRNASSCQISSKSVKPLLRYNNFSIIPSPLSWICNACAGTTHEGHLVVFITLQNLIGIDAVVLIICTFFDFASLAWKRLFKPQNWGFWPPKWGAMWKVPKKGTSLREPASFEPSCVKICQCVWPVGEFPKGA